MRFLAVALLALALQEKRLTPEEAALKEADKAVRDNFKDDYAKKTPADRRALAKKLLAQGREPANPPATQYAALLQAVDVAAQAGDVDTCTSASDALFKGFAIDVVAQRTPALASLAKNVKTPEDFKAVAKAYMAFADDAASVDRYDDAAKAVEAAVAQAKKAKDLPSVNSAEAKGRALAPLKARYEKIRKSKETLLTTPDDPAANAAVGQYLCLAKEDWSGGVPLLVKGADGPMKAAALLDAAADKLAAGNAWWDLAESAPAEDRVALRARAGHWYLQVQTKLTGLERKSIDKRLNQCCVERNQRGNWIDLVDPAVFGAPGKPGDPIEVTIPEGGRATILNSKALPPGEYDGLQVRVRYKGKLDISVGMNGPGYARHVDLGLRMTENKLYLPGDTWPTGFIYVGPMPVMEEYLIQVVQENGKATCWFNGEEQRRWPNANPFFDQLRLWTVSGTATYDKIRIRKR